MGRKFWIEMSRYLNSGAAGDGGGAKPAGHAADAHEVRHDQISRACCQCLGQRARAVEIFAELYRRRQFACELGVAGQIVVRDRLLEPEEVLLVERVTAMQRVAETQSLIEIDHQFDVCSNSAANGPDGREVVFEPLAPEP